MLLVASHNYIDSVTLIHSHLPVAENRIKREKGIYRRILESDVNEFKLVKFLLHFPFGLIFGYGKYMYLTLYVFLKSVKS